MAEENKKSKKSLRIKISNPFKKISLKEIKFKKLTWNEIKSNPVLKTVGLALIVVLAFALIDLFVQYLNNDYSIAVVNGQRISKNEYYKILDAAYGEAAAQQLIDESIIKQEAKLTGVEVTDEEIATSLQQIIDAVGGQAAYESALKSSNLTETQLKDQIRTDELTKKVLEPQITYTDDDLKGFFDQYSSIIFPDETAALEEGEQLDFEQYKDKIKDVYVQQQVETMKSTWLDEKANEYRIQNNTTDKPKYGVFTTTVNIIKNVIDNINTNATK